jgi:hypothetical protein
LHAFFLKSDISYLIVTLNKCKQLRIFRHHASLAS